MNYITTSWVINSCGTFINPCRWLDSVDGCEIRLSLVENGGLNIPLLGEFHYPGLVVQDFATTHGMIPEKT